MADENEQNQGNAENLNAGQNAVDQASTEAPGKVATGDPADENTLVSDASTAADPAPVEQRKPESEQADPAADAAFKAAARRNLRWLMAELDWIKSGRTHEERERLNP